VAINNEIRLVNPGRLIDLFTIDFTSIGVNEKIFFYRGVDASFNPVVFQGDTYAPWPIEMTGFERKGQGPETRPKVFISNHMGLITQFSSVADDLIGARVTRKRTLEKYLGTTTTDETTFSKEEYYIEQKFAETSIGVEFDLSSPLDFVDRQLPSRMAIANSCPWSYKGFVTGSGCGWVGDDASKWFDRNDVSVLTQDLDVCGKTLSSCRVRFGQNEPLDFGGFPALGRL